MDLLKKGTNAEFSKLCQTILGSSHIPILDYQGKKEFSNIKYHRSRLADEKPLL